MLIIFMFCFTTHSCKKDKNSNYYIISDQKSIRDSVKAIGSNNEIRLISPRKNWYTSFVILLDSTDKVYIYQTEFIKEKTNAKPEFNGENNRCLDCPEYSNHIGLKPEQMLTFDSRHFIEFIKNNQDIFEFDTLDNGKSRCFTIASNKDTIQNVAFYDLKDLITKKGGNKNSHTCGLVRKTTEEENAVIFHKRRNLEYHPDKINWSTNFIDGKYRPFTKEYQSAESKMKHKYKATSIINKFGGKVIKEM